MTEQLGLEGMPARLFAATPSRLVTWLDCPRRYRLAYLDRPPPAKGPPWAHNSLGASVHAALAGWWRLPLQRRTPAAAGALLEAGWLREGFADEEQSGRWRARARTMVEGYVAGLDPRDEPVGVERTVSTRTGTLAVSGRIDRLDVRADGERPGEEELVVVDYKTGRRVPGPDDVRGSLALALYAVAAARVLRRRCHRVELHHLPTGSVVAHRHTDAGLARHVARAEAIAAEVAAAHAAAAGDPRAADDVLAPRPGPQCAWCDYSRHCPQGRAFAPPRRPWDGLAPE